MIKVMSINWYIEFRITSFFNTIRMKKEQVLIGFHLYITDLKYL